MNDGFSPRKIAGVLVAIACVAFGSHGKTLSVIPKPVSIERKKGFFTIFPSTRVIADDSSAEADKLINTLSSAMGFRLQRTIGTLRRDNAIKLELSEELTKLGDEGYELIVSTKEIAIRARRPAGLPRRPYLAAKCKAVSPFSFGLLMSTPALTSSLTRCKFPRLAALRSATLPRCLAFCTAAPLSSRSATTSK